MRQLLFSTHVGLNRAAPLRVSGVMSILHTRGVEPNRKNSGKQQEHYSPHTWGWTKNPFKIKAQANLFSTHVGLNRLSLLQVLSLVSILHTRGVEPRQEKEERDRISYSPHTWGWTANIQLPTNYIDLFSTHVGLNREGQRRFSQAYTILHTRGVEPSPLHLLNSKILYSPHTWGWTVWLALINLSRLLFSTHVGLNRLVISVIKRS